MGPAIAQGWQAIGPLFAAIGAIALSAGAITAFAYWIFQTYSAKWLDNKFAKELETYRHEHQRELQRLKLEIDELLDRKFKLHSKEFDTLPEAWSILNDAFAWAVPASMAMLSYADLNRATAGEMAEVLAREDLPEFKKEEVRAASDKNKVYADALQLKQLSKANKLRSEFHSYVLKNGIFFPDSIRKQFLEIDAMMVAALVEREMAMSHPHSFSKFDEAMKLHGEGRKLVEKLQSEIHDRLWSVPAESVS